MSVTASPSLLSETRLDDLGVRLTQDGGTLRVWSRNATAMQLVIFDSVDVDWPVAEVALESVEGGVWQVTHPLLTVGAHYAIRVTGPQGAGNSFDPKAHLLEPYSRGVVPAGALGEWRSVVVDSAFDWGGVAKPATGFADTVIYEGHVKGLTKRHPDVPPALHGTYAGVAHPAMIEHYRSLGVTAIELLPVHAFITEPWLASQGRVNYWGYNTLNFFSPHVAYATKAA